MGIGRDEGRAVVVVQKAAVHRIFGRNPIRGVGVGRGELERLCTVKGRAILPLEVVDELSTLRLFG